ncbi:hypothetical protein [Amycolatopsis regifaucium]|uniref:Integral membrane protein n=1 Tax=Amycolatopsis regifaucium TaxID=546365 RepID=A0A154MFK7_9PSEU|nr:hypothetical protein [Amycolatopsis regifaucium]KZB83314.1 hypothetical protein AVL48_03965 [Amycolatopsis regifaucium]OKA08780.1 hypothetical protein ATP06_0210430 [Amycolatopsis regifaucium]SFI95218.1 hypothetical protein SAMN04489731_114130 [Amycolatopsis regifaucium]
MDLDRRAADAWFRRRGLPMVIHRRRRGSGVLRRSTPGLVFLCLLDLLLAGLLKLLDVPAEVLEARMRGSGLAYVLGVLALMFAVVVVPAVAGRLMARLLRVLSDIRVRLAVMGVTIGFWLLVLPIGERLTGLVSWDDPLWVAVLTNVVALAVLMFLVRIGVGSILTWAARSAVQQVRAIGMLASRALPLLLLVVMFSFFTAELWQAVERLSPGRLWLVVGFLVLIGAVFLASMLSDEIKELKSWTVEPGMTVLRGTPFDDDDTSPEPAMLSRAALTRTERLNIALVLFLAQAVQIVAFGVLVFAFFVVFGVLILRPEVVTVFAGRESAPGTLLGVPLPVSSALINVSLFLAVFSGLYFAASTATDARYRRSFFEPLLEDVKISLAARDIYLAHWADVRRAEVVTLEAEDIP